MISVVTTVYNGEKFVEACFETVNNQRFREFDWILIDDGSTDLTAQAIESNIQRYPGLRTRFFRTGKIGRGAALNFGISQAAFDWIAVLDIDDLWHPRKLEIQARVAKSGNCRLLCTNTMVRSSNIAPEFEDLRPDHIPTSEITLAMLLVRSNFAHSSVLARRQVLNYDANRSSQFDLELWLRLLRTSAFRIVRIEMPLTVHVIHEGQNYESGNLQYGLRSIRLRLVYSLKTRSVVGLLYNFCKLSYYMLPRALRMRITKRC